MAAPLVVVEGFDAGYPSACLTDWIGTFTFQPGRVSGQSLYTNNTFAVDYARRFFTSANNEISLGIAVRLENPGPNATPEFFAILDSGGSHLLEFTANNTAWWTNFYTGGTALSATQWGTIPALNTWGYLEIKFVYGTAGYIEVRWNGVPVWSRTGVNTRTNASTGIVGGLSFGAKDNYYGYNRCFFDDLWIESGTGSDFRGDRRVITLSPTADASVGWASSTGANHWGEVDDLGGTSATYVSTPVGTGAVDTYTFGDMPSGTFQIDAVAVKAHAQTDFGSSNIALHRGGTVGQVKPVTTTSKMVNQVFETDAGSAPWTTATVNSTNFGIIASP